jgi:hypothetical protein
LQAGRVAAARPASARATIVCGATRQPAYRRIIFAELRGSPHAPRWIVRGNWPRPLEETARGHAGMLPAMQEVAELACRIIVLVYYTGLAKFFKN